MDTLGDELKSRLYILLTQKEQIVDEVKFLESMQEDV